MRRRARCRRCSPQDVRQRRGLPPPTNLKEAPGRSDQDVQRLPQPVARVSLCDPDRHHVRRMADPWN